MTLLKFYLENDNFMGTYHIESNVLGTIEGSKKNGKVILKEGFIIPLARKHANTKSKYLSIHFA